ncbi:tRNA-splicing ligase RtcB-domain-containing protein [Boeremia exigua]|uniref:tRNA-splicing ligase RtcB-domain-containing protein n=1 Tax=Boeremia exigua TaxID=749465 RepID=UPI001E8EC0EF|nr:tRNA-splicing ligase RtcB-domain-containing protein [Boeremia exigua]KAH6615183.1 tRNA-splicing ligase RtcB-domain-containing protein [Boeremia exigua]
MATRVTVANNAKQSQKTPLVIPASLTTDPAAASSVRALVFKTAQSKLKVKKPSRVFVKQTGYELVNEQDWKSSMSNDIVLLVSSGEEYVGVGKETVVHEDVNSSCPVEILASNAEVESLAITQLDTTAHTLPGIIHAVGQPDLHPGTKFPIGAVFASKKWIHPPLIGGDIGCGMAWYRLALSRSQVDGDKGKKVAEKLRGLEGPWRTQENRELWLQDREGSCSAGEEWDSSLGTIGAGNHFAEIQVVEESSNPSHEGIRQNDVVLLVHSGSRGYGGSVLKKYTADSQASLEEGSPEAIAYLEEHDKACRWAKANRDLIALRFLACLEPGNENWQLGVSDPDSSTDIHLTMIEESKLALQARKVVDIWHNNVERVQWPPSALPSSASGLAEVTSNLSLKENERTQEYVYIHRKGAAPTYDPRTHLPLALLPLPGSRGTPTLILQPSFSEATSWGLKNALSLAHGAGRSMSRAKALSSLSQKYRGQNILQPRAGEAEGTWVICDEKDLVFEEAPDAYKDVQAVGQDLVDAGVATNIGWCRARVSYKVRNETR